MQKQREEQKQIERQEQIELQNHPDHITENKKRNATRFLAFAAGTGILAFGLYNIHSRSGVSEGGALGLSLLFYHWFGISPGIASFFIDMTCYGIGTIVMGKGFLGDSIIASAMYACWYQLFQHMGPVLPDFTEYPYIAAVLGALFVGIGAGLVVRHDCASGGDDALALSVHKLTGIKVSRFYVISDFVILALSLSYIPFRRIGWSMGSVLLSSAIIEMLRPKESDTKIQKHTGCETEKNTKTHRV